jgi:hypothetical protein
VDFVVSLTPQKEAERLEHIKAKLAAEQKEEEKEALPPLPVAEVKRRLLARRKYNTSSGLIGKNNRSRSLEKPKKHGWTAYVS